MAAGPDAAGLAVAACMPARGGLALLPAPRWPILTVSRPPRRTPPAGGGEAAAGAGAWLVRIVLLTAWLGLRAIRPQARVHRTERARRPLTFIDLEANQPALRRGMAQ